MNRTVVTLILLISGALLLSGCQSAASKAYDENEIKRAKSHYNLGLDAINKNQLPKAFDELMQSDAINPNQPEVLDLLAYSWYLHGNLEKSELYYKRAIQAGGGSISHNNYGGLLLVLERYDEAKKHLEKALEDPRYRNQYKARINLGDALLGLKQYDDAINAYRDADRFGARQTLSRLKEAQAYIASGRLNYAQALYETMLQENSSDRAALVGLVDLLKLRNNHAAARKQLMLFKGNSKSALDRAWAADELEKFR